MNSAIDLKTTLLRVSAGEANALRDLHLAVSDTLLGIIISVLKDRHEAEDTLQEVFLKFWKNSHKFNQKAGSPISWMITVARNTAFDRYRKFSRTASQSQNALPDLREKYTVSPLTAPELLLSSERREEIRKALNSLADDQRVAIELAFFSGHSQSEVAEQLDLPLGTVKARIRRGMISLKPLLSRS